MQVYAVVFLALALGVGVYKAYAAGFEKAELENRLKSAEVLREARDTSDRLADRERAGRRAADKRATVAEQRGEALALAAETKWRQRAEDAQREADEANAALAAAREEAEAADEPLECPPVEVQPRCPADCYRFEWESS